MVELKMALSLFASSLLFGQNLVCTKFSQSDKDAFIKSNNTFNVIDFTTTDGFSITTKEVNKKFFVKIVRRLPKPTTNETISIVNIDNGNVVYGPIPVGGIPVIKEVELNKAYSNLKFEIDYDVLIQTTTTPYDCYIRGVKSVCYQIENIYKHYSEFSTDNFAVRPNRYDINVKDGRVGGMQKINLNVVDYKGNVVEFNTSSNKNNLTTNKDNIKYSYHFNVYNGRMSRGMFYPSREGSNIYLTIKEKDKYAFAKVDKDDTIDECLYLHGTSNEYNVSIGSKSWSGAGTGEIENDPKKNTVQVDKRTNTTKDVSFRRVEW